MKKPYKVLSTTALAAVLAASSLVPVMAQAAEANEVTDVIVTKDGVNYKMTIGQYSELLDLNKAPSPVKFITSTTGKVYTIDQYSDALDVAGNIDEALTRLDKNATAQTITTVDATFDSNGNLVTTPVAGDLKVESVSAINASELKVTFGTAVDAKTAKDSKNYDIKVNNVAVDVADNVATKDAITVAKDGKSAIIRLATTFQNGDKYVVQTNDGIKSADGKALAKFVSDEATFTQSAAPKLLDVKSGTNNLKLTFDRPVNSIASTLVKVDGYDVDGTGSTTLTQISNAAGSYTYTVDVTDSDAIAEAFEKGTHEVIVYDVEDTAKAYPAKASVLTGSYTITDQVTVPEVKEVVAVNANKFFLRTNVKVDLSTAKLTVEKGNHEFALIDDDFTDLTDPSGAGKYSKVDAIEGTYLNATDYGVWVIVTDEDPAGTDENPLYKGSETTANLKVTLENFKDDATKGLLGKKSVTNVTLNKNNSKPVVESTKVVGNTLVINFGADLVKAGATFDKTDVVVRNKEGVIISDSKVNSATIAGTTVVVDLDTNYKVSDEPYSVEFKAGEIKYKEVNDSVEDYLVNTIKNDKFTTEVYSTSTNFKYKELNLAVGSNVTLGSTVNGQDTVSINYDTDMDDSARNVANYQLDGKALPAGSTVDFLNDKKNVRIVLPEGSLKASTSYKLTVSTNVKTKEGSVIVGSLQTKAPAETVINLDDNIAPTLVEAKFLRGDEEVKPSTSTNTLEVTFSEAVEIDGTPNGEELDDLKIVVSGTEIAVNAIAPDATNSKRMIVTLGQDINVSQAATITVVAEADQKGDKTTYIIDKAGNKAKAGSSVIATTSKYNAGVAGTQALAAATAAVTKAESTKTMTDIDNAQTKIDALPAADQTALQNQLNAITSVSALNEDQFKRALTKANVTNITLASSFIATDRLDVNKAGVTIDGNDKTITGRVLVSKDNVTVKNLTVDNALATKGTWSSMHAVQVYDATGVTLDTVTLKNSNVGLYVNSSTVAVKDITTDGNGFGGVGVGKGTALGLSNPSVTVTGTNTHTDAVNTPALYADEANSNWITAADYTAIQAGQEFETGVNVKAGQTWFKQN